MERILLLAMLVVAALVACGNPTFEHVPDAPAHTESEDGAMHAVRFHTPFVCGSPSSNDPCATEPCPIGRPVDPDDLSCDAAGCHGNFEFDGAPLEARRLFGGDGPSCYTCHGEKWNDDDECREHQSR